MTTLAFDGKTLCTDSQISSGNLVFGNAEKILKLKDGSVVACAGSTSMWPAIVAWLDGGDRPEPREGESFTGIRVFIDGSAHEIGKELRPFPACVPWSAGTGEMIAMTAMRLGKSSREAIEIACQLDVWSGLPVQEYVL